MEKKPTIFKKVLSAGDILVIAFGAMIGWGWVVSCGSWIQNGGILGTILGFIVGGIMIYFVGLTYAELTTAMPKAGGEHVFSYKAFGVTGSYICTWALILSYLGVVCYEVCSFPTILEYIFPSLSQGYMYTIAGFDVNVTWVAIAIVMSAIIVLINILGTKKAAIFQTIFTIIIAITGLLLLSGASFTGSLENVFGQAFKGDNTGDQIFNIVKIAMMTPFFFFGFDVIPQAAEEVKIPLKKLGKIMMLSIVLAILFYAMIVLSIGLVMNESEVANSIGTTGLVTADAMAKAFSSKAMANVLIIGGLCGIITSWNSFLIGGSRAMYSMAKSKMLPSVFAKVHKRYKTPSNAILVLGVFSIIAPFLGKAMLTWIVNAANFACCLAYCMVAISFIVIRKKHPNMPRPYKIKHYKIVGAIAIIMSGAMALLYIIPGTNCTLQWPEWIIVGVWATLGILFYFLTKRKHKKEFASNILEEIEDDAQLTEIGNLQKESSSEIDVVTEKTDNGSSFDEAFAVQDGETCREEKTE